MAQVIKYCFFFHFEDRECSDLSYENPPNIQVNLARSSRGINVKITTSNVNYWQATDSGRSTGSTMQNNFLDSSKQGTIDLLLIGSVLRSDQGAEAISLLESACVNSK